MGRPELALLPFLLGKFPGVAKIVEASGAVFSLAYLFKKSSFYSPALRLQGVVLARLDGEEMRKMATAADVVVRFIFIFRPFLFEVQTLQTEIFTDPSHLFVLSLSSLFWVLIL
jgi:hypothetical protein